jgi:hypothetical protein
MINHIELIVFSCRWNRQKSLSYIAAGLYSRGVRFESRLNVEYPDTQFSQVYTEPTVNVG